jgi:diguanylate cyclase (GGDEF)-like protein
VAVISPSQVGRRRLATGYNVAVLALVIGVTAVQFSSISYAVTHHPQLWMMTALAAFAGTQAFISTTPSAGVVPVIVCPTICFTFAILLCWGLGPALVTQLIAVVVVAWRLHRPMREAVGALGQYAVAFVAAQAVLMVGNPDPLHHHSPARVTADALSVVGAVCAWLIVYAFMSLLVARLFLTGSRAMPDRMILSHQVLFKAALLTLSPMLAIAAHLNIGFVPLIFVPLYAVERMAKLSAQRDRAARLDPLSGLANRAGLKVAFHDVSADTSGTPRQAALLLADLDEFKHVNDALGHEVGDQLLIAVAQRFADLDLADGAIARLGGDEFAVITSVLDQREAETVAQAMVTALSTPVSLDGLRIDIAASIGVAVQSDDEDFATLMRPRCMTRSRAAARSRPTSPGPTRTAMRDSRS